MLDVFKLQKQLVEAALPSGFESRQGKILAEYAMPYVDEVYTDTLGNVICHKKGKGKKLMMPAHMDVIGFLATFIDKNGFVRFTGLGGHSPALLVNAPIVFENGVHGCIRASESAKLNENAIDDVIISDLYIDIGAADKAEAEKLIKIGYTATFDYEPRMLANSNMMTPYADNLASCIALLIAMSEVKTSENDLYFVFSVQEELGLRGARSAAYNIMPYFGIAVDLTHTGDTPGETVKMAVSLGKGPAIKIKDSSLICNPQVVRHIRAAAEDKGIVYQDEILLSGGTDGAAMQRSHGGVLSGVISIPGRNIHTAGEIINIHDVEQAGLLLAAAAEKTI